jgi:hypothetical protein
VGQHPGIQKTELHFRGGQLAPEWGGQLETEQGGQDGPEFTLQAGSIENSRGQIAGYVLVPA